MPRDGTVFWTLVTLAVWLVPVGAFLVDRRVPAILLRPLVAGLRRQPPAVRLLLLVFAVGFLFRGGAKPGRGGSASSARSPARAAASSTSPRGEANDPPAFAVTDFAVSTTNRTVAFEVAWASNAFDAAWSRYADLFMSTNLSARNWIVLNDFWMPEGTNRHAFTVSRYDVRYDAVDAFTGAFGHGAFFTFGLDVDTDDDGLTDAYETLVLGSSPLLADTDGDGLDDDDEEWFGSDATNPDTDGDGITDDVEYRLHLNPRADDRLLDTDEDGLTDYDEVFVYGTRPTDVDGDGDGLTDSDVLFVYHTDPTRWTDSDGDGLSDGEELFRRGTDRFRPDTDGDGVDDGVEVWYDFDPLVDESALDTDGDGLMDFAEVFTHFTNRFDVDSDDDGLTDGDEILT